MEPWSTYGAPQARTGLRPTRQRLSVLRVVETLGVFSSAKAVHQALGGADDPVALSTVYRSLQVLTEHGILDVVRGRDGELLYRRCLEGPHHHLVCRRCGDAVELPGLSVGRLVRQWGRSAGYVDVEHVLEAFGTCPACVDAGPPLPK